MNFSASFRFVGKHDPINLATYLVRLGRVHAKLRDASSRGYLSPERL